LEKKETTTGCTSSLPDSNGTSVLTTSDGLRDSDDVCGCCCVPEFSDEELERVKKHLAENPYVSTYLGKFHTEPSEECLEAARQALERQEKMKDVSDEEWIRGLSKDLGEFKD